MVRILTHVHLYYTEMWPELKSCLANICVPYDLFVTVVKEDNDLKDDILRFKSDAEISVVENRGFDVAPFINLLNKIDLSRYDYIIKLHSKRNMPKGFILNEFNVSGNLWREYLLNFIKSPKHLKKCLKAFEIDPQLGMISDYRLICKKDKSNQAVISKALNVMEKLSFPAKEYHYVMGTMFMARAELFKPLLPLSSLNFEPSDKSAGNTNSFIGEIIFGFAINAQGYRIEDVLTSPVRQLYGKTVARLKNFIWRKKVTSSGKIVCKFCKIPVFVSKNKKEKYSIWSISGGAFKTKRNKNDVISVRDIPVYLISFNRLSYLQSLIPWLEKAGCSNIHIIDNASTYPPLLEYLDNTPHTVHRMEKNYGHTVLFDAPEFKDVVDNQYFALSDPDILPVEDCPFDFMTFLYRILKRFPKITKAGFSLKLDDLPDHYALKETVIKWENSFYNRVVKGSKPVLYKAPIDTTFALYRPRKEWRKDFFEAIRTGFPYQARHLPWYKDLNALTPEDVFYNSSDAGSGNWNGTKNADFFQVTEKSYIKLFGCLPVMKIKRKKNKKTFLLFCFLPVFRIKENKQ